ncbi:hypothetical protein COS52_03970 [Candidatus Roizmanbacteria bacterium CG03_land_8_20_14_0_80_39_12]|uniref:Glycosyltransferase RgtA/B/C/D-like domain-containing protein n=1 Tax=Candidatus Roizmanbacteria bacterium CG03_land_8_20_14_0_80_39_12 TaxID=1974847 RepID=A0A2M7BRT9_9BACT|nr:MAG: hypothetical protein COS52_03970 [Candidatus Roizmanbacteria bacterium CG03_land_8_20_14_0_80_39_12]
MESFINSIILILPPFRMGYLFPGFPLANFDGVHYLAIAQNGYTNNMRFMPLYPLVIHLVKKIAFFIPHYWIGFFISLFFFIGSIIYLIKLLRFDYSNNRIRIIILALIVFPTSFFFLTVYSESLFLFLTVASLYYARKEKWYLATFLGFFASLTRIVGFLIVVPLVIEFFSQHKIKKTHHLLALLFVPLGTLLYAIYNYMRWNNPLLFIQAHSQLSNGRSSTSLVFFPQTLYRYFKMLTTVSVSLWEWKIALLEVACFSFAVGGIYILRKQKVRLSYIVYTLVNLLIPASTGTFTGLPRYIIVLFPLFLVFSSIKNRVALISILVASFILQLILFLYFSRGYYVAQVPMLYCIV